MKRLRLKIVWMVIGFRSLAIVAACAKATNASLLSSWPKMTQNKTLSPVNHTITTASTSSLSALFLFFFTFFISLLSLRFKTTVQEAEGQLLFSVPS